VPARRFSRPASAAPRIPAPPAGAPAKDSLEEAIRKAVAKP
jgi:hypothetical protein